MSALLQLQEAVATGDVLLSTLRRDIGTADIALTPPLLQAVTATIWNATTGSWCQHFTDLLDEQAAEAILELRTTTSS